MCGIFGVINFNGQPVDKEKILSARDVLTHRGPDDCGVYFTSCHPELDSGFPSVALTHRRLSIIDLSHAGRQPMSTNDGRFTIVFNGEIYNYRELIDHSGLDTESLRSTSDTEVLLQLYAKYGKECLPMLRGMFSFAVWDDKEKILFAARDRFGIKPFFYSNTNHQFVFASEIKAIKHYKKNLTTSMQGIDAFLRTGSVPAPLTIYNEVQALLPGQYLTIKNAQLNINAYWDFNYLFNNHSEPARLVDRRVEGSLQRSNLPYNDEAKINIRNSLLDSVRAHMIADVEVGAFLSGGIDSTAIVSLMRQVGQEKIKTINISFPGNKLDESTFARKAADTYTTANYEYNLTEDDVINELDKIFESMDQPTIDGINTYFVSKAAKDLGLKVVLSGVGGDELFGGYPSFTKIPRYQRLKNFPFAKSAMKIGSHLLKNKLPAKAIEYMQNPDAANSEYKLMRGLFTDDELKKLQWNNEAIKQFNKGIQSSNQHLSSLQYISMMESTNYMRNQLLADKDVFSMTHSLELRVPFIDHLLYESVLPYLDDGFNKNLTKRLLVEAVGDLPDEIVNRPKMGFTFPFADWLGNGKMKALIKEELMSKKTKLYIDHSTLNIDKLHWSRLWSIWILSHYF